jgi:hypothetical protein
VKYPVLYGPRADGKIVARCPLVPGRVVVENTPGEALVSMRGEILASLTEPDFPQGYDVTTIQIGAETWSK